jgi:hypothetical protein
MREGWHACKSMQYQKVEMINIAHFCTVEYSRGCDSYFQPASTSNG